MLDISTTPESVMPKTDDRSWRAMREIGEAHAQRRFGRVLGVAIVLAIMGLFLPWTQNIRARGTLTSLSPEHRPQTINAIIPGRIEQWYVAEGDLVQAGDTILRISEVRQEYFDPNLLDRTQEQIMAKEMTARSYEEKVHALDAQIAALQQNMRIRLEQARNKVRQAELKLQSDSIRVQAARTEIDVAQDQLRRGQEQFDQGLVSMVELERRRVQEQRANATHIDAQNKLLEARNELLNAELELGGIQNEYRDRLAKAESEKYSTLSQVYDTEASISKMQVDLASYTIRAGYYIITAPQDGYITRAVRGGVGELIREGESLITIMPSNFQLAVELYVRPMDMPLINLQQKVRFMFDGWPAIIFSGWPNMSYGTYGGRVVAVDNLISPNGRYRILVAPDPEEEPWPGALRVGAGAVGIALLKDVRMWYELWRQFNGFPPDLYQDPMVVGQGGQKEEAR
jgi:membrane fusion protein, adhesin transport system